jgi:hypothetical protein
MPYTPNWARVTITNGYYVVFCSDHPRAWSTGYVYVHQIVAELKLGRFLAPGEVVHHEDEDKFNNHPDNLKVQSRRVHAKEHATRGTRWVRFRCPGCHMIFERERRQTHLVKPTKIGASCCSDSCRGWLSRTIQLGGDQREMALLRIQGHVLEEFVKYNP